ncbi:hypothetical protein PITCH_A1670003 [uncultured Desulfobacterium sp.]|uniref:Uncharacterized protein n=1 Tax=uncultured Desulfobacterium sp. TaxID=201089 RepID=A0A445MUA5_9BACT|nr:hypothetical protein PITCH_A1670003 [uncultured Desulfobacterium sp.]
MTFCEIIIICLEQMTGEAVTEGMGGGPFGDLGFSDRLADCLLQKVCQEFISHFIIDLRLTNP